MATSDHPRVTDAQCLSAFVAYEKSNVEVVPMEGGRISIIDHSRKVGERLLGIFTQEQNDEAVLCFQLAWMRPILEAALNVN